MSNDLIMILLAIAVVATMYGTVLANAVAGPMGDKLALRSGEEILSKEMMLQGILSIQAGDNPRATGRLQGISGLVSSVREDVARLEDLAERLLDLSRSRATAIASSERRIPQRCTPQPAGICKTA